MFDWDKSFIAVAFKVSGEDNTECTILVATSAYDMDINNPDIKVVIWWDLSSISHIMI